jgi:hypothetical protein
MLPIGNLLKLLMQRLSRNFSVSGPFIESGPVLDRPAWI